METKDSIEFIIESTKNLLSNRINPDYVETVINNINNHFLGLVDISEQKQDLEHLAGVPSKAGIALSFNHAAECLLDYRRTRKFLRGVVKAIKDQQEKYPNKTVEILYAGCGPLAPFLTLVAPLFSNKEVQFTLLEINEKSLSTAKRLIKRIGLTSYVHSYHCHDAITFKIPNPERFHILFSETLDALLHREPYVPILWNLLPQLPEKIIVIPGNVQVKLNFKVDENEIFGKVVFDTRKALAANKKTDELPEKLSTTFLSLENANKYYSIVLDTEVQIYKEHILMRSESSLSLALEIPIHKPIVDKGVDFTYNFLPQPSLQIKMVE